MLFKTFCCVPHFYSQYLSRIIILGRFRPWGTRESQVKSIIFVTYIYVTPYKSHILEGSQEERQSAK